MTKTLNIETVETYPAEPARDTRWTCPVIERIPDGRPLHYSERLGGWTWGASAAPLAWGDLPKRFFPLTEVEPPKDEHKIAKYARLMAEAGGPHVDKGDDTCVEFATYDGLQDFTIHLPAGARGEYIDFTPEQAAQLRDFLNENVKTTQA